MRRSPGIALRLSDILVLAVAVVAITLLVDGAGPINPLIFGLFTIFWLEARTLYRARVLTDRMQEWRRLVQALATTMASVVVVGFVTDDLPSRSWLFATTGAALGAIAINRELWRLWFARQRGSGEIRRRTILVGATSEADMLADMLTQDRSLGYEVVHRVDPQRFERPELLTTDVLASVAKFDAESALIAGSGVDVSSLNRLCRDLVEAGVHVEMSMSLIDIMYRRLTVRPLGRFPVAYLEPVHRGGIRPLAKRAFDVVSAGLGLIVLSPFLLVIALAVRFGSDGPVFFRQERVGRDGRAFDMIKFRTMVVDAEERLAELKTESDPEAGPLFKMREDPRVTRVGRFLRRSSLDEIPQLVNVVKGEMSLVGPRPALRSEMVEWSPELYGRLRVRPGITGLWQVSGRSEASFDEYTRLDLYYVDNWSLAADLRILARTVSAVVRSSGAY